MSEIDVSIPRKMFWSSEVDGTEHCPECQSPLENDSQTYLLAVGSGRDVETFIAGNDAGYFCSRCPVVVLEHDEFEEFASMVIGESGHTPFRVLGIIDLDAVPESKQDLPLGDEDNPVPLVEFTNRSDRPKSARRRRGLRSRRRGRKGRRRRK